LVVGPASGSEILGGGDSAVGDGVDVVPLQMMFPSASVFAARDPIEVGWGTHHEGGSELGGLVAADVSTPGNGDPVVDDNFPEGIGSEPADVGDRDGPAADDVAGPVGVVAEVKLAGIDHHHEIHTAARSTTGQ
jgi:hypothetical protein